MLGRARLELLPSGALAGAAQLAIELGDWRGIYAGAVNGIAVGDAEPLQVRACDELVIDAPEAGGIVDDGAALQRAIESAKRPLRLTIDRLDTLAAVIGLVGAERVMLGPKLRRLKRSWSYLERTVRAADAAVWIDAQPTRDVTESDALAVYGGRRAPGRGVALGMRPDVDAMATFVEDTGATRVWIRVGSSGLQEGGAAALASLLRSRSRSRPRVVEVVTAQTQLSLFAHPPRGGL